MKTIRIITLAAFVLAAFIGPRAGATGIGVTRAIGPFPIGAVVTGAAVTPEGRYLLMVSAVDNRLRLFDTWDFTLAGGANDIVDLGGVPTSVAASPDGNWAYIGLANGHVNIVDLSGLLALEPHQTLEAAITPIDITLASAAITRLIAVPDSQSAGDPVFLIAATATGLRWGRIDNGNTLRNNQAFDYGAGQNIIGLAAGEKLAFYTYTASGAAYLMALECSNTPGCFAAASSALLLGGDTVSGLAADPVNDRFALVLDPAQNQLRLFDTRPIGLLNLADSFTVDQDSNGIAALADYGLAATASGATIVITEFTGSTVSFTGSQNKYTVSGASFSELAASADGYLFAATGDSLYLATPNAWIRNLTIAGGSTVTADTMTVSFRIISAQTGSYTSRLYNSPVFAGWGTALKTETSSLSGNSVGVSFNASTSLLDEATVNVFTVITEDSQGRKGRMAATAWVDTAPPAPGFSLGFGDRTVRVDINGVRDRDLAEYRVYYGTNGGDTVAYTALNGADSPLVIINPGANQDYSRTIKGLKNGVKAWVQVVVEDESGNVTAGERLFTIPQMVARLSELAGEEGGVDCLGSISGKRGDPGSAAGLLVPLAVVMIGAALARRKK